MPIYHISFELNGITYNYSDYSSYPQKDLKKEDISEYAINDFISNSIKDYKEKNQLKGSVEPKKIYYNINPEE